MRSTYIIAEAGVNHNGSIDIAEELILTAVRSGADAVKFQTFSAKKMCSQTSPKAEYQQNAENQKESQLQMLERYELDRNDHIHLLSIARHHQIQFISSPFDDDSIDLLDSLGLNLLKIPSGEITNLPYLEKIGALKKDVILSTGMADLDEINSAIRILEKSGMQKKQISILHCCSEYPADFENINLNAIKTMTKFFPGIKIGFSDHSEGTSASIAAVAIGACIIEKHFTLDQTMEGPDHRASLNPEELKGMIRAIRQIEKAMGNGIKKPTSAELLNKKVVRKSIVAMQNIKKGEKFSQSNLTTKRPGSGLSPMEWHKVIGKTAKTDFRPDDLISL